MSVQILNPQSFPPGSSRAFIDYILKLSNTARGTEKDASDAVILAQAAKDLADAAKLIADAAAAAAEEAHDLAVDASNDAAAAQYTANIADGKADNAQATADSAQSTANAANGKADTALADAAAAQSAADDAQTAANNKVDKTIAGLQAINSSLQAASYLIAGVQVVGARLPGWTPSTGSTLSGGINGSEAYPVGGVYSQAEMMAIASGLQEVRRVVVAVQGAITVHGLIGP